MTESRGSTYETLDDDASTVADKEGDGLVPLEQSAEHNVEVDSERKMGSHGSICCLHARKKQPARVQKTIVLMILIGSNGQVLLEFPKESFPDPRRR